MVAGIGSYNAASASIVAPDHIVRCISYTVNSWRIRLILEQDKLDVWAPSKASVLDSLARVPSSVPMGLCT